jgi:VWFA-related protein
MPIRLAAIVSALVIAVASLPSRAQDQETDARRQRFRSGAHYVRVDVYPMRDGRPIAGLTPADFELLEDGTPQVIDSLEFIAHPQWTPDARRRDPNSQRGGLELARDPAYRVFVLYLDAFHVDFSGSNRVSRPIADLLNRLMGPQDLFGVLTPAQSPKDLLLGQLTQTIDEQLTKHPMWGLAGRLEPQPGEAELEFYFPDGARLVALRRLDKVYTDLEGLIALLGDLREERKNILYFSDSLSSPPSRFRDIAVDPDPRGRGTPPGVGVGPGGTLTMGSRNAGEPDRLRLAAERSRLVSIDFDSRFRELIQRARHANVSFYVVRPGGLDPGSSLLDRNISNLETLAQQTDGLSVLFSNDPRQGMTRIAQDLSSHYVLGYYTGNTRWDGRTRKITVRLRRSGETVRARREYRAPTEAEMASIREARDVAADTRAPSAIDTALSALSRVNPVPRFSASATQAGRDIAVVAEIGAAEMEAGRWNGGAGVNVMLSGPSGEVVTASGRIEPGARGTLIPIQVTAGSGPWQAHVRIRSDAGAVESDTVAVDRRAGTLLAAPIVYRAASAAASAFRPASILYFRRTERVRFEWPVLEPLEEHAVRVLDRAGTPLTMAIAVTARETAGQRRISADMNLAPLSNGDYLVEISGRAGEKTERHLLAIRVVYTR